jgi:hypothetical protein
VTGKDSLRFALGATAGLAVAFVAACVLLMPPSDMMRWVFTDEPVRDRLARVFSPPAHILELRAAAAKSADALAICKADHEEQRKRGDDLEFKLSAARPEGAPKEVAASCARDYATVRGLRLKPGEGVRHVGGRVYVGLESVGHKWCRVHASTDLKRSYGPDNFLDIAEALIVESTMGKFRLVATKVSEGDRASSFCEFDLVREP